MKRKQTVYKSFLKKSFFGKKKNVSYIYLDNFLALKMSLRMAVLIIN